MNYSDQMSVFARLREAARLAPAEVDAHLAQALDPDYWRALNPTLPLAGTEDPLQMEGTPLSQAEIEQTVAHFHKGGYFQTRPVLSLTTVGRMHQCVEKLRAAGWPPVFSYVYDIFWQAVQVPSLRRLFTACLGSPYRQNSRVWTHYVVPVEGQRGWAPHSDDQGSRRITVWVPFVPATLDNGCMYVIPRNRKPDTLPASYSDLYAVDKRHLSRLLQGARALPAQPGEILGWEPETIHWGSYASGNTGPRISISLEMVADDAVPAEDEFPLAAPGCCPSFPGRLLAISQGLFRYTYWEPLKLARYGELAKRIKAATQVTGLV